MKHNFFFFQIIWKVNQDMTPAFPQNSGEKMVNTYIYEGMQ